MNKNIKRLFTSTAATAMIVGAGVSPFTQVLAEDSTNVSSAAARTDSAAQNLAVAQAQFNNAQNALNTAQTNLANAQNDLAVKTQALQEAQTAAEAVTPEKYESRFCNHSTE